MKLQKIKFFNVKGAVFIMNKLKIRFLFTFVLFGMLSTHLKARIRKKNLKAREGSLLQGLAFLKEGGRERQGPLHINSRHDPN